MKYPGRVIRLGEADVAVVKALKKRLNQRIGAGDNGEFRLDPDEPIFDARTQQVVKLYQARHVDALGRPLKQDGEVGSLTWAALFGDEAVPAKQGTSDPLLARVIEIAGGEADAKVREAPVNSNRGPRVNEYLRRAGVSPGLAWCCAFTYWCFDEAAGELGKANPMARTAGCLDHWQRAGKAGVRRLRAAEVAGNLDLVEVGMVFIINHGRGLGHTGLVERVAGGLISTIEGNTDASRTREGGGVYRLNRKTSEINTGFIDYRAA